MTRKIAAALVLGFTFSFLLAQGDFQKGISYYKQGQYARAIEEIEPITKENPEWEDGFRLLGDCYLKTRRYEDAISTFQKALRLKNDLFVTHQGLAVAFFNTGRFRDVAATLLRAEHLARSPAEQYELFRTRGSAYFNLKEYEKAASDLERAVSIQRNNLQDVLQLGVSYHHLGNSGEAERYLRQAQSMDPNNAEARRYLSHLGYQKALDAIASANYPDAVRILSDYVTENPEDGEAWFNLGLAHLFAKNLKEAEDAFLKGAQFLSDQAEIYDRLGYIYETNRNYSKALQNYQKAYSLTPTSEIKESVERIQERIRRQREG